MNVGNLWITEFWQKFREIKIFLRIAFTKYYASEFRVIFWKLREINLHIWYLEIIFTKYFTWKSKIIIFHTVCAKKYFSNWPKKFFGKEAFHYTHFTKKKSQRLQIHSVYINSAIFLPLRFYVKSILKILQKLKKCPKGNFCNF